MKCPICHGKGRIQDHKYNEEHDIEYLVYCEKKCEYCNGTGEVQMTNEDWFCGLSTEEKARFICNLMKGDDLYLGVMSARDMIKDELNHGKDGKFVIYEWLKEIHQ